MSFSIERQTVLGDLGFVEMETYAQARAAIKALDGKKIFGKPIAVKEARPKPKR